MSKKFWKRWALGLGYGLRRFPLALAACIAAAIAAACLNHNPGLALGKEAVANAWRVLLLWPLALFGNLAWRLRAERDGRNQALGLMVLAGLLAVCWFLLPSRPQSVENSFWFAYGAAVSLFLIASALLSARRTEEPSLWDTGYPVARAVIMGSFSALIVFCGIAAALVSLEKLFGLKVKGKEYMDVLTTAFFLVGPVTAFALLPKPFGEAQPQPRWIRGAARLLLAPLSLLYALILLAYICKIALAGRWPDGWVAMPVLIFAALGLVAYLIARVAFERENESWALWLCRAFPIILLPMAIVLLMAMRVRVLSYGFTEWRTVGVFLGIWLLGFALLFSLRQKISIWWIAATLGAVALVAVPGLVRIPLCSQSARLENKLETLGVWQQAQGASLEVSEEDRAQLRSVLAYLLRNHGVESLPDPVSARWRSYRVMNDLPPIETLPRLNKGFVLADEILTSLGISGSNKPSFASHLYVCDSQPMPIGNWQEMAIMRVRSEDSAPFYIDSELRLFTPQRQAVGAEERENFFNSLDMEKGCEKGCGKGWRELPADRMGYQFRHEGRDYRIVFEQLLLHFNPTRTNEPFTGSSSAPVLLLVGPADGG